MRCKALWELAKPMGFKLKLNTVVCRHNIDDDMGDLALELVPDRWKVFKVLPIDGQNSGIGHAGVIPPGGAGGGTVLHTCAFISTWTRADRR